MKVGNSIRLSIDDWSRGEIEAAMLHACNAIDGTARKLHPGLGNKRRFVKVIRDNYSIFGPMAMPGMNAEKNRFHHVEIKGATTSDGVPDVADIVYGVHRCAHGHGDDLPKGFELIPDARLPFFTSFGAHQLDGSVQLSDRTIFALLAIAVLSPANQIERVPDEYYLTYRSYIFPINKWWGQASEFLKILEQIHKIEPLEDVIIDFSNWSRRSNTSEEQKT
ncbi:hypothetical protein [Burkholderia gladioli]|uniref:hypothetical protein n=1 Tax=Burkholderia gladioli TaxID=28095 RepID=UPI001641560E|nr:hypothetical protein [Burkholderia gladioli]